MWGDLMSISVEDFQTGKCMKDIFSGDSDMDGNDTAYLLSKPSVVRDILEGLATSWEDCIPEAKAMQ